MQRGFNEWEQGHLITREIGLKNDCSAHRCPMGPCGKLIIGDVVEQREVEVFRAPIVWYINLLEYCTALEGQTIAQQRFCDRQQCPRQYVVLFDGLIAETQPMGQARDFSRLNHVSRPNDSL
jgi:hypothetical protein